MLLTYQSNFTKLDSLAPVYNNYLCDCVAKNVYEIILEGISGTPRFFINDVNIERTSNVAYGIWIKIVDKLLQQGMNKTHIPPNCTKLFILQP